MGKIFLLLFMVISFVNVTSAQSKHRFVIKDGNFLYDGKPVQIHSCEIHFARVPKAYWMERLERMKALG